jgi:hypothetical protein
VKVQFVRGRIRIRAGPAQKQGLLEQGPQILRDGTGLVLQFFQLAKRWVLFLLFLL